MNKIKKNNIKKKDFFKKLKTLNLTFINDNNALKNYQMDYLYYIQFKQENFIKDQIK